MSPLRLVRKPTDNDILFYCSTCNTGFDEGIPSPCPVCTTYGGHRPKVAGVRHLELPKKKKKGSGTNVTPTARLAVFRRDAFTCRKCGTPGGDLTIDHHIPRSKGGTNDQANLRTMCRPCNNDKGDELPEGAA